MCDKCQNVNCGCPPNYDVTPVTNECDNSGCEQAIPLSCVIMDSVPATNCFGFRAGDSLDVALGKMCLTSTANILNLLNTISTNSAALEVFCNMVKTCMGDAGNGVPILQGHAYCCKDPLFPTYLGPTDYSYPYDHALYPNGICKGGANSSYRLPVTC